MSHPADPTRRDPRHAILQASRDEPYARKMGLRCLEVGEGSCRIEMTVAEDMANLFGMAHGGAVFSLIDEAFQVAANAEGVVAYALNLSVTYVAACYPGDLLVAEAQEVAKTGRTATYAIRVCRGEGELVATAQALAYRKGGAPPFLAGGNGG